MSIFNDFGKYLNKTVVLYTKILLIIIFTIKLRICVCSCTMDFIKDIFL